MKRNKSLLTLVQCSLLLSIGLAFRYFSAMIPIGGVTGMRISASGFFTKLPALLFGPFYGAAVGGLSDFLGWLIRQDEGAYIFPMTLSAALGGLIFGFVSKKLKKLKLGFKFDIIYISVSVIFGLVAVINLIFSELFSATGYGAFLINLSAGRLFLVTYGCAACCIIASAIYLINYIIAKYFEKDFAELYMKVLIGLLAAYIPVTTINTFILIWFYPALQKLNFYVVYLPRLVEEIVISLITAYILTILCRIYHSLVRKYIN